MFPVSQPLFETSGFYYPTFQTRNPRLREAKELARCHKARFEVAKSTSRSDVTLEFACYPKASWQHEVKAPQCGAHWRERTELRQIRGEWHLEVVGSQGGGWQVRGASAAFGAARQSLGGQGGVVRIWSFQAR